LERIYPRFIVIHHTAGFDSSALTIDGYHRARGFGVEVSSPAGLVKEYVKRGFKKTRSGVMVSIGYHYLIRAAGDVEKGRPDFVRGAHCTALGMNFKSIGIALTGNFDSVDNPDGRKGHKAPTSAQISSLRALLAHLVKIYQIPESCILRHKDVKGAATRCPGDRFWLGPGNYGILT